MSFAPVTPAIVAGDVGSGRKELEKLERDLADARKAFERASAES